MNEAITVARRRRRRIILPIIVGIILFVFQLSGQYSAGLAYGLLFVSVVLLIAGIAALAVLVFTSVGDEISLSATMRWLFSAAGWAYVIGVFDLSGHFIAQALIGQVELQWIFFGPAALVSIVLFDIGMYQVIYSKNQPTWERYRQHIRREDAEPEAMRDTFIADVAVSHQPDVSQWIALASSHTDVLGIRTVVCSRSRCGICARRNSRIWLDRHLGDP